MAPPADDQAAQPRRGATSRRTMSDRATSSSCCLLMGAVTYPWRAVPLLAPGFDRLPTARHRVPAPGRPGRPGGPGRRGHPRRDRGFGRAPATGSGIELVAVVIGVAVVRWRRNVFLGILAAVLIVAVVRLRAADPRLISPAVGPSASRGRVPSRPDGNARSRRQERRPRHDRVDLQVLARCVVVAADRTQAVERGHAQAGRRVGVRGAAGRRVAEAEAEARGEGDGLLDEPRGDRAASPSASGGPSPRSSVVTSGTWFARGDRADLGLGRLEVRPGRAAQVDLERRPSRRRRWAGCHRGRRRR